MLLPTLMKSGLAGFSGDKSFGAFHVILADSLEYWFSKMLSTQSGTAVGTTVVSTGVIPSMYTVTPVADKLYFSAAELKHVMSGPEAIENLFDLIGTKIITGLSFWESASKINAIKMPNVAGVCPVTFETGHFRALGKACKIELSSTDPLMDNLLFNTWLTIEKYLKNAINSMVPGVGVLTGATNTGGVFTGQATIKLVTTL